jgi:hypothetical protein
MMGANPTQAQAVALFFLAMIFIAGGFAAAVSWLLMIIGLAIGAASIALFLKCKPWELKEK